MPYKIWREDNTLFVNYKVRNHQIDSYGHINNATYLQFLEDARADFFSFLGHPLSFLAKNNIYIYITEISIKYLNPGFLDDVITVSGNVTDISKIRATWHQNIYNADSKKLVTADVKGAFLDSNKKGIRIPEIVLKGLESMLLNKNIEK